MPAVDGSIKLHPGVAALVRGLGNLAQYVARLEAVLLFTGEHGVRPPVAVANHGLHELVRGADAVIGVLEEDRAVSLAIERGVIACLDQRVSLLFFLRFAPDELFDIRVIGVEDHHLRRPTGLAAALDDPGEGVEALHEAERSAGASAAGEGSIFFTQRGEVRTRARA